MYHVCGLLRMGPHLREPQLCLVEVILGTFWHFWDRFEMFSTVKQLPCRQSRTENGGRGFQGISKPDISNTGTHHGLQQDDALCLVFVRCIIVLLSLLNWQHLPVLSHNLDRVCPDASWGHLLGNLMVHRGQVALCRACSGSSQ